MVHCKFESSLNSSTFYNQHIDIILQDQGLEVIDPGSVSNQDVSNSAKLKNDIPILGFYQTKANTDNSGRIVVYGDSNCIDSAHLTIECW